MKKFVPLFLAAVFALVGCKTNKEDEGGNQDASTYAVWPTEDMAIVVKGVKNGSTEVIPPFEHADKIEIEWEKFLDDGYFTIELETTKQESQNEYKTVLENAGWDFGENDEDGYYKKCPEPIAVIDLPGIYSLSPYTNEEVIARNYIIEEKPDCIIDVVDASNLERNLYLSTQILEMDVPVVIALNFMDVVEKNGEKIDVDKLSKKLGVPVIPVCALKQDNLDRLMDKVYQASKSPRSGVSALDKSPIVHLIKDCQIAFEALHINHPLFHAVKLVELDEIAFSIDISTVCIIVSENRDCG